MLVFIEQRVFIIFLLSSNSWSLSTLLLDVDTSLFILLLALLFIFELIIVFEFFKSLLVNILSFIN